MSHSTEAIKLGGHGCGMDNKKPRNVKHQHDRLIDKRRRRIGKEICQKG